MDNESQSEPIQSQIETFRETAEGKSTSGNTRSANSELITEENLELPVEEFSFRLGLLLGATLFFYEAVGGPWSRGIIGIGAIFLSALIVITMTFQWKVLGDFRRTTQRWIYLAFLITLSFPIAAVLSPHLGTSFLPVVLERPLMIITQSLSNVPGIGSAISFLKGVLSFFFLMVILLILLLGESLVKRTGVLMAGSIMLITCLFFYPTPEILIGFLFLAIFLRFQWEIPLLVPDKLKPHLSPVQISFMRELVESESLTTGETKLYLDNDPQAFAELMEYRLIEYDPMIREVFPGPRLTQDPATKTIKSANAALYRVAWIAVGLAYFIAPDPIPGPIDDLIILFLCAGGGTGLMQLLQTKKKIPPRR